LTVPVNAGVLSNDAMRIDTLTSTLGHQPRTRDVSSIRMDLRLHSRGGYSGSDSFTYRDTVGWRPAASQAVIQVAESRGRIPMNIYDCARPHSDELRHNGVLANDSDADNAR